MTDEQLFLILRPHIASVSGCAQILMAPQNKNAPTGDYGTIIVRYRNDERGQANIYRKNVPGERVEFDVRAQRVMTCAIEFFRGNAKLYAERLQQMNRREDVVWSLFKNKISIRNVGHVMDLTALQSSNYENRARVEIVLWMEGESKYEVNNILGVDYVVQNEKAQTVQNGKVRLTNP